MDDTLPSDELNDHAVVLESPAQRSRGRILLVASIILGVLAWSGYFWRWNLGFNPLIVVVFAQIAVVWIAAVLLIKRTVPFKTGIATLIIGAMTSPAPLFITAFLVLSSYQGG